MLFYKNVKMNEPFPHDDFKLDKNSLNGVKSTSERITKSPHIKIKSKDVYTPIQYYTSSLFYQQLNKSLKMVDFGNEHNFNEKNLKFSGCLIRSLQKLPNYTGFVHRGINEIRLSHFHKTGDMIYFKQFTSSSKEAAVS